MNSVAPPDHSSCLYHLIDSLGPINNFKMLLFGSFQARSAHNANRNSRPTSCQLHAGWKPDSTIPTQRTTTQGQNGSPLHHPVTHSRPHTPIAILLPVYQALAVMAPKVATHFVRLHRDATEEALRFQLQGLFHYNYSLSSQWHLPAVRVRDAAIFRLTEVANAIIDHPIYNTTSFIIAVKKR
jgi:hypothetical protein